MKKLLPLALALFALSPVASSQQQVVCRVEKSLDLETDRQALVNLEQGLSHALQLNNSTIFNSVFSDDFSGVTWYGEVIDKARQIQMIQTSSNHYDFVHSSNFQVKIFRDTASVSSLRTERGTFEGRQFNRQFRVFRLYLDTPQGWRVVAQQETQLPGK